MGVVHYSASDLAELTRRAAVADALRGHLEQCEQCHVLLELVRRVEGEPSEEQAEVLLDLLVSSEALAPGPSVR